MAKKGPRHVEKFHDVGKEVVALEKVYKSIIIRL